MKYRRFGKLEWEASVLGFGAMRLPVLGGDRSKIDEPEAIRMIRYAIDRGVNYVDTAYGYHGGNSEALVGKALKEGYREKVRLATKMPTWLVEREGDFDRFFEEQLSRLDTEKIDLYLLHGLKKVRWPKLVDLDVFSWAEEKISEGEIGHFGFSFHDEVSLFKQIVDAYDGWTFCQIQYNFMDTKYQAGTEGLRYAAENGLAVVVMEPIKGGKLAVTPPKAVRDIWDKAPIKRTPADWALQWVWNHPEVSVVLSGMSTMQQVKENIKSADRSGSNTLTKEETTLFDMVRKAYNQQGFIGCTNCRYCMPCPQGVDIPVILNLYNEYYMAENRLEVKEKYLEQIKPESRADQCVSCAECEEKCPQQLPIRKFMSESNRMFQRRD